MTFQLVPCQTLIVTILRHVSWRFPTRVLSLRPGVRSASCGSSARKSLKYNSASSPILYLSSMKRKKRFHPISSRKETNEFSTKIIFIGSEKRGKIEVKKKIGDHNDRDSRSMRWLVTLHESEGIFRHGRNMLKTGCIGQVSKSKEPLGSSVRYAQPNCDNRNPS